MLPLMRTSDTIQLVHTADPAVKSKTKDAPAWVQASEVKPTKDALVVTVRPMTSPEVLRLQSVDEAVLAVHVAKMCTQQITTPNESITDHGQIDAMLDRLQPAHLAGLGGKVLELSLLPEDPTDAPA